MKNYIRCELSPPITTVIDYNPNIDIANYSSRWTCVIYIYHEIEEWLPIFYVVDRASSHARVDATEVADRRRPRGVKPCYEEDGIVIQSGNSN